MPLMTEIDPQSVVGRAPEQVTLEERNALVGKWIALEVYSPKTLPLRRIEAIGDSTVECIRQLATHGLDPRQFEYTLLTPPY